MVPPCLTSAAMWDLFPKACWGLLGVALDSPLADVASKRGNQVGTSESMGGLDTFLS